MFYHIKELICITNGYEGYETTGWRKSFVPGGLVALIPITGACSPCIQFTRTDLTNISTKQTINFSNQFFIPWRLTKNGILF